MKTIKPIPIDTFKSILDKHSSILELNKMQSITHNFRLFSLESSWVKNFHETVELSKISKSVELLENLKIMEKSSFLEKNITQANTSFIQSNRRAFSLIQESQLLTATKQLNQNINIFNQVFDSSKLYLIKRKDFFENLDTFKKVELTKSSVFANRGFLSEANIEIALDSLVFPRVELWLKMHDIFKNIQDFFDYKPLEWGEIINAANIVGKGEYQEITEDSKLWKNIHEVEIKEQTWINKLWEIISLHRDEDISKGDRQFYFSIILTLILAYKDIILPYLSENLIKPLEYIHIEENISIDTVQNRSELIVNTCKAPNSVNIENIRNVTKIVVEGCGNEKESK